MSRFMSPSRGTDVSRFMSPVRLSPMIPLRVAPPPPLFAALNKNPGIIPQSYSPQETLINSNSVDVIDASKSKTSSLDVPWPLRSCVAL